LYKFLLSALPADYNNDHWDQTRGDASEKRR